MKNILSIFSPIKELSPLLSKDAELFRAKFKHELTCYANSWLYILRSSRDKDGNFGFKYQDSDSLFSIGFRNDVLYIINPNGKGVANKILKLCNVFSKAEIHKIGIVIKKADEQVVKDLVDTKLFGIATDISSGLLEDEIFPENIIDLEFTFPYGNEINPKAQNLRKAYRSFEKNDIKLNQNDSLINIGTEALYEGLRSLSRTNHNKWLAYKSLIDEVCTNQNFYNVSVFTHDNKIHGIYISEIFPDGNAGLYCAVTSRQHQGITEWMDVAFFQNLANAGVKRLYLGGSETEGVHVYVKKLLPKPVIYNMLPLVYLEG